MDKQRNPVVRKIAPQSPFHRGLKDFGLGNISNPYPKNTQDNRDWEFGFNKSYFTNLERLNGKTKKTTA
jgi:hypothetical protein